MDDINRVELRGRLAADPVMRVTQKGDPMAAFTIGVQYGTAIDYMAGATFGTQSRVFEGLAKGSPVHVVGRMHTRSWETPDGKRHYRTEVVTSSVESLELRTPVTANSGVDPEEVPF